MVKSRKFGGRWYSTRRSYSHKNEARANARRLRKRGWLARVVKAPGGWALYRRRR